MGDPSSGTRAVSREHFDAVWDSKLLFVIHNRQEQAQFNTAAEWRVAPHAPLVSGLGNEGGGILPWAKLGATDN
jgi:predicted double-glycine peptidase